MSPLGCLVSAASPPYPGANGATDAVAGKGAKLPSDSAATNGNADSHEAVVPDLLNALKVEGG